MPHFISSPALPLPVEGGVVVSAAYDGPYELRLAFNSRVIPVGDRGAVYLSREEARDLADQLLAFLGD